MAHRLRRMLRRPQLVAPIALVIVIGGAADVPVTVVTAGDVQSQVRPRRQGALAAGDTVVLANLDAGVPASNSTTTTRGGLTGGLGGTSGPGGLGGSGGAAGRGGGGGRG